MAYEFSIVVPAGKKKERIDTFLVSHVENATRNKVQLAIKAGEVLVDGRTVRPSYPVAPGEVICITLPKPPPQEAQPEDIPLELIHEDENVIVVNKPAGMVVHPAYANYTGTLVNALLHHTQTRGGLSTLNDAAIRPGIVHRLDKDTSGLLVVAKNDIAHAKLAAQFSKRTIVREYQAIVWGRFSEPTGLIEADLGRSKSDRKKMAVIAGGKPSATEYAVIEQFEWLALVRLKLRTGRTHQIRVHLAHIGHPVFGDPTYNGRNIIAGPGNPQQKAEVKRLLELMPRQALHARTLGFVHPQSGKREYFESRLPDDMERVLAVLRAK